MTTLSTMTTVTRRLHVVLPGGVRDLARPSGGNAYDVRVCGELVAAGWQVTEHLVDGAWPSPAPGDRARLGAVLAAVPSGATVLVDGLVGSGAPEELAEQADRLRLVALVHMPFGHVVNDGSPSAPSVFETERRALQACRAVVTTSQWTRRWVVEHYRLDAHHVRVATPGADVAEPTNADPAGTRLLCVGAVSRLKGHDVLAAALASVPDLPWRLVLAGSTDVDLWCAEQLQAAVARAGLGNRVELAGALAPDRLAAVYAAADLLVSASRAESYGMALTEGLARGIPAVATDVGGVRQTMGTRASSVPALLVPPDDPVALAAALRTWLTDEATRTRLRAAAAARRTTLPSWAETARSVAAALRPAAGEEAA